jgi:DNA repair protein RadA/Sms
MARFKSLYVCQQCSYETPRWFGKCAECGEWNTAVETVRERKGGVGKPSKARLRQGLGETSPVSLASVSGKKISRVSTGIGELDRVLGGGLVAGQVILVAGEPGIGKSTLLLQVANELAGYGLRSGAKKKKSKDGSTVIYVSGEESVGQLALRGQRLGIKNKAIEVMEETSIDSIAGAVRTYKGAIKGVVVDSIQTMATSDLSGMAGSVGQVRECTYRLVRLAKGKNIPVFIVGHVTKQGSIAGPSVLMHLVDTVLWFEGDKNLTLRMLRAVKNRFGPTDEVGIFAMEEQGLVSMSNPEKLFLTGGRKAIAGSVVASIMRGTRPVLVEIQSLIVPTKMAYPKRIAQGFDSKRLELLLAVLTRRCGLPMYEQDCFVNVAGGILIRNDPSADLAICLSIASSFFDRAFPKKTVAIGEVGLLGDVREVVSQEKRVKEAKRLGYRNIVSNKEVKYLREGIKTYLR